MNKLFLLIIAIGFLAICVNTNYNDKSYIPEFTDEQMEVICIEEGI